MITRPPMINSATMITGIMFGGISRRRCAFGVYLDDAATVVRDEVTSCSLRSDDELTLRSPGWVPLGVTRPPPDFRFGGAIGPKA